MLVDIHSHVFPPVIDQDWVDAACPRAPYLVEGPDGFGLHQSGRLLRRVGTEYWDLEARIGSLDAAGIDLEVVSALPMLVETAETAADGGRSLCSRVNEWLAAAVSAGGGRIAALGLVPTLLDDGQWSSALEECVDAGFLGVEIGTTAVKRDQSALLWERLASARGAGMMVLLHPTGDSLQPLPSASQTLAKAAVGIPTDTALAMLDLLATAPSGRPHLGCLCLSHGGGPLLWFKGRADILMERQEGLRELFDEVLGELTVDTAGLGPANVNYLASLLGRERIAFGTDFPASGDPVRAGSARGLTELDADLREAVSWQAAGRLLNHDRLRSINPRLVQDAGLHTEGVPRR